MSDVFEYIGIVTVIVLCVGAAALLFSIYGEAARSYRQVCRKARVHLGRNWQARVEAKRFLRAWGQEFCSNYTYLVIGNIRLPHDPREPVRRVYFG